MKNDPISGQYATQRILEIASDEMAQEREDTIERLILELGTF